jgi:hypothetical protein
MDWDEIQPRPKRQTGASMLVAPQIPLKSISGPEAQAAAKVVDTGSDPMPLPQCSTQQPIRDSEPMDSDDAPGPAKVLKAGPESMDLTGMTRKRKRHLLYTA